MKLYGRNPVIERLRFNPNSVIKIYLQEGLRKAGYIRQRAKKFGIPLFTVPKSKIQKIARNANTQGIVMQVEEFFYVEYRQLIEESRAKKRTVFFLDGINDPQNLGSIIRSLACLGKFAIVIPKHKAVAVTETVLRVAAGGDNFVSIARVGNLRQSIQTAKDEGYWIAGSVIRSGQSIYETTFPYPLGVLIGSEQKGIRDVFLPLLDMSITIPMAAETLSFNVSQATTLFCYEIMKQKRAYEQKKEK
ncbi:MAG: RNA methyltransferase [Candidatus Omnitrophica bacterium]|nr:RNA methyltransferase [Candidatus Omnitrophota bacterium]